MSRVAVMGSGSWGTAFAMILADAGGDVVMWSRDADLARQINDEVGPIVLVDGQEWEGEKGWTHFHP